ncbi:hypothetical protein WR25_15089 [Diploscapter pachys]|uniref:Uncharacterized protein n=1 Tax=Diploscapter pachys TaxID=2018661 RepID=A0A2A2KC96_9BILA|nr:hypothetical protein WR25_15089 [Diploscapter pachys]
MWPAMSQTQQMHAKSKELDSRCRLLSERIAEGLRILDHDPSVALYRLQEHVNRNLPALITRRIALDQQHSSLDVIHSDLDNAIRSMNSIKNAEPILDNCMQMLKDCIAHKQQIDFDHRKVSEVSVKGRSKSMHEVNRNEQRPSQS